jgi:hypothetical protein
MEIAPIPGIRMIPYSKTSPPIIGLQPVFDMENYAHISDESYTPNQEASDSGMEDAYYDSGEPTDDQESPTPADSVEDDGVHHLDLIA